MSLGFIILRCVQNKTTDQYWVEAYTSLRKFYPLNKIIIIDDNSKSEFVSEIELQNTKVIDSEYKGRGELLPYIYFLRNPIFDKAVIIHDSVFFQKKIDFDNYINLPLFSFGSLIENREKELFLISKLNNKQALIDRYNKGTWSGCFGVMSVIDIKFLEFVDNKYSLENLLEHVTCRQDRMALERVFGVIFSNEKKNNNSVFGNIFRYCKWGYSYSSYLTQRGMPYLSYFPVIKIWTGR
jgi:hypothetical protein